MHQGSLLENSRAPHRVFRIRTEDWPARDRLEMFRELHGRGHIRVDPQPGAPLRIDVVLIKFPELGILQGRRSALRSEFADGSDRLMLNLGGPAVARQFGREVMLERGDAIALSGSDPGSLTTLQSGRIMTLEFPQGSLIDRLGDARRSCARRIPEHSLPLRLLRGYVGATQGSREELDGAGFPTLAIAHIGDLVALAIGAGRAAEEMANGGGLRAGRLQAIKNDLLSRLADDVPLGDLSARHGVSARYIRMLFESEGTTMTDFVREARLSRARSMLLSPRHADRRIAEIAYAAGFNDVSYFNRSFRRRFGCSPSEFRSSR